MTNLYWRKYPFVRIVLCIVSLNCIVYNDEKEIKNIDYFKVASKDIKKYTAEISEKIQYRKSKGQDNVKYIKQIARLCREALKEKEKYINEDQFCELIKKQSQISVLLKLGISEVLEMAGKKGSDHTKYNDLLSELYYLDICLGIKLWNIFLEMPPPPGMSAEDRKAYNEVLEEKKEEKCCSVAAVSCEEMEKKLDSLKIINKWRIKARQKCADFGLNNFKKNGK